MYDALLIRYGEIGIKKGNRHIFENRLLDNIRAAVADLGERKVTKTYGRMYVELFDDADRVIPRLQQVFGIVGISPAKRVELDIDAIKEGALEVFDDAMTGKERVTFKVEVKRPNKKFPMKSPELARTVGGHLLWNRADRAKVDVHQPEITVQIEVRQEGAFIYAQDIPGIGGLPVGSSGKGILLLSGGIDSPVAGWLAMKRGVALTAVYFHSFPFTTDRAKEKVLDLARVLARYGGPIDVHVVHFTDVQKAIYQNCPPRLGITIMRRMMFRLAERIARQEGALALFTGESVGQVASQTLESLAVTNAAVSLPILRPLVAMDKREIVDIAQQIGTYDISILPYEDCCTLFVPKHPETKPRLVDAERAEESFDFAPLLDDALNKTEVIRVLPVR